VPAPISAQNMPSIRTAGSSAKLDTSVIPLRIVLVTEAPTSTAPENSKIAAMHTACHRYSVLCSHTSVTPFQLARYGRAATRGRTRAYLLPTLVANELATSFAPVQAGYG
jgi:hypothetical protein